MPSIQFFQEDVVFKLQHPRKTVSWIKNTITEEGKTPGEINFILCSDEYLLKVNQDYLNHNTYTDIITFDTSETEDSIDGDIFISIDRIKENAIKFSKTEDEEIHRVIIHGVLHLIGYGDKSKTEKAQMREMENNYLAKR